MRETWHQYGSHFKISKLSWRAIEQDYSLDKYEEELEKIARQERNYTPYVVAICTGFACGGFCKLFGGDWIAFLITAICTFVGFRTRARCIEFGINVYMSIAISAFYVLVWLMRFLFRFIFHSVSSVAGLYLIYSPRCAADKFCGRYD